jgi:hypothetical protein
VLALRPLVLICFGEPARDSSVRRPDSALGSLDLDLFWSHRVWKTASLASSSTNGHYFRECGAPAEPGDCWPRPTASPLSRIFTVALFCFPSFVRFVRFVVPLPCAVPHKQIRPRISRILRIIWRESHRRRRGLRAWSLGASKIVILRAWPTSARAMWLGGLVARAHHGGGSLGTAPTVGFSPAAAPLPRGGGMLTRNGRILSSSGNWIAVFADHA